MNCLKLKKVDSQKRVNMFIPRTEKQVKYFYQVIKLHYEEGLSEEKISRILPIGHTTASRWIAIFADEQCKEGKSMGIPSKHKTSDPSTSESKDVKALEARIKQLERQLEMAELKAEFYDEMINVAEAKFNIPIRKKAGTKQ